MKKETERYTFTDLDGLKQFLNGFQRIRLDTVYPDSADYFELVWIEETLSDGSIVHNVRIETKY